MEQYPTFETLPAAVSELSKKLDSIEQLLLQKDQPNQVEQLMTIDLAADYLSLSKPTLYSKVSKGEIPVMKRGKRLYFSQTELLEYVKSGRKRSNSEIEEEANSYLETCK